MGGVSLIACGVVAGAMREAQVSEYRDLWHPAHGWADGKRAKTSFAPYIRVDVEEGEDELRPYSAVWIG